MFLEEQLTGETGGPKGGVGGLLPESRKEMVES